MKTRLYSAILEDHFLRHRQMAFVSGPRQVGKTTTCRALGGDYLNWDNSDDRRLLLRGPSALAERLDLQRLRESKQCVVLDELHKHGRWKTLLKGFFDTFGDRTCVVVTGSSKLDVYRHGGDSLMGRFFPYRMHPFSVAECVRVALPTEVISPPKPIDEDEWRALWEHGGFPEPFLRRDPRFSRRWRSMRHELLAKQDLREVTRVQELSTLEALMQILRERSGSQLVYASLSAEISVSVDTVKRWVDLLSRLHYGFLVRPWFANVTKALRKEPKWFLRDWSGIDDVGARAETLIACHLLKAVEGWTDLAIFAHPLEKVNLDWVRYRPGLRDFVHSKPG